MSKNYKNILTVLSTLSSIISINNLALANVNSNLSTTFKKASDGVLTGEKGKTNSSTNAKTMAVGGGVIVGTSILNELMGFLGKRDRWYNGKYSLVNKVGSLCENILTKEEKIQLASHILDVIDTFDLTASHDCLAKAYDGYISGELDYKGYSGVNSDFIVNNRYYYRVTDTIYGVNGYLGGDKSHNVKLYALDFLVKTECVKILRDLTRGDFESSNMSNMNDKVKKIRVKKIRFSSNAIRIIYEKGSYVSFELSDTGVLKINSFMKVQHKEVPYLSVIKQDSDPTDRLSVKFTLEKPKE